MKSKITVVFLLLFSIALLGCKQEEEKVEIVEVEEVKIDLVNDEFPEAKKEVLDTWDAIAQSLKDGDLDEHPEMVVLLMKNTNEIRLELLQRLLSLMLMI